MKKTLIVLMMALFATMLIVSCNGDAGKTINITYDLDGGTLDEGVTNPTSAMTGDVITPTAPKKESESATVTNYDDGSFKYDSATLTNPTYTFKGWKVKGSEDSTAAVSYTAEREDVTLVAVWETKGTISDAKGIKLSSKVTTGKTVTLGKYDDEYNKEGIVWTVLTVDNTNKKALLFASSPIGSARAHISSGNYTWENSQIKEWLNKAGTDGFISQCGLGEVKMVDNTDSSVGTVFLLSKEEAINYGVNKKRDFTWWFRDAYNDQALCFPAGWSTFTYENATLNKSVLPAFWISISE